MRINVLYLTPEALADKEFDLEKKEKLLKAIHSAPFKKLQEESLNYQEQSGKNAEMDRPKLTNLVANDSKLIIQPLWISIKQICPKTQSSLWPLLSYF